MRGSKILPHRSSFNVIARQNAGAGAPLLVSGGSVLRFPRDTTALDGNCCSDIPDRLRLTGSSDLHSAVSPFLSHSPYHLFPARHVLRSWRVPSQTSIPVFGNPPSQAMMRHAEQKQKYLIASSRERFLHKSTVRHTISPRPALAHATGQQVLSTEWPRTHKLSLNTLARLTSMPME